MQKALFKYTRVKWRIGFYLRNRRSQVVCITIAIVEDDLEYQKQLQKYIEQYGKEHELQYKITVFQNGLNFLEDYKGGCEFDIYGYCNASYGRHGNSCRAA